MVSISGPNQVQYLTQVYNTHKTIPIRFVWPKMANYLYRNEGKYTLPKHIAVYFLPAHPLIALVAEPRKKLLRTSSRTPVSTSMIQCAAVRIQ